MNLILLSNFTGVATTILYIFIAIIILLAMIMVHEFGHYISGRIFGFGIEEFSIGFGPKIFSKQKKNGELFALRAIPLGGYCAFTGEDENSDNPKAFNNKKPWQRIIVLISGALMNYLLAIILIISMFGFYGHSAVMAYTVDEQATVSSEYSLKNKDVIISCNDKNVYMITDLIKSLDGKTSGEKVNCYIYRNGEFRNVSIMLLSDANFSNLEDISTLSKVLGIKVTYDDAGGIIDTGFRTTGIKEGFFTTIGKSFEYSMKIASTIFTVFGQLINGSLGLGAVGGTITTISVTANAIKIGGLWSLLNIASFIGVNLAVFNLLPIPALDGSRVVFTVIEWIRKKPVNRKIEGIIHTVGFILILLFAIIVDLQQCF